LRAVPYQYISRLVHATLLQSVNIIKITFLALYPTNITGVRGVSTVCRATGTNEVDHMPGGIDHMPSGIGSRPSGIEL